MWFFIAYSDERWLYYYQYSHYLICFELGPEMAKMTFKNVQAIGAELCNLEVECFNNIGRLELFQVPTLRRNCMINAQPQRFEHTSLATCAFNTIQSWIQSCPALIQGVTYKFGYFPFPPLVTILSHICYRTKWVNQIWPPPPNSPFGWL